MGDRRIAKHPILDQPQRRTVLFTFNGQSLSAKEGEVISSALFAAGITVFGHHHHDGAPQGLFCANGQCSQCTVIADGRPVKSCMVEVSPGMEVRSLDGLPELTESAPVQGTGNVDTRAVTVLVVGGGPAGLNAAAELGQLGINVLVVDDKPVLGGKLCLQTHNFFGSVADCYAGTRGMDIGHILEQKVGKFPTVEIWLDSTVVGVFSDQVFGISRKGAYTLVKPEAVLIATGAREKTLVFPGSDLPGVYGAGAFQTLVNRDLVKSSERLFIIGGGNVGLIAAYHALQAGIDVVGLVEALPQCGGYRVHEDKIRRLGVPIFTSHSVVKASGDQKVQRVTIARIDDRFVPVEGTRREFEVDTVLVAVGLAPVDELYTKATEYGIRAYAAGDAEEIAEASAAIFSGKIVGRTIGRDLGADIEIPRQWEPLAAVLRSKPGELRKSRPQSFGARSVYTLFGRTFYRQDQRSGSVASFRAARESGVELGTDAAWEAVPDIVKRRPPDLPRPVLSPTTPVYPVLRCNQEIPCDPCARVCPLGSIFIDGEIVDLPEFLGKCQGCNRCVLTCPGLAITVVREDHDNTHQTALVTVPFELENDLLPASGVVTTAGMDGAVVGVGNIVDLIEDPSQNRRKLVVLEVPFEERLLVAGFRTQVPEQGTAVTDSRADEDPLICHCERVSKSEIVAEIQRGTYDMNQLKAAVRCGMGACGGKTCAEQVLRVFREQGVDVQQVVGNTIRPFVMEIHLGDFVQSEED